eukprot:gene19993-30676_t
MGRARGAAARAATVFVFVLWDSGGLRRAAAQATARVIAVPRKGWIRENGTRCDDGHGANCRVACEAIKGCMGVTMKMASPLDACDTIKSTGRAWAIAVGCTVWNNGNVL